MSLRVAVAAPFKQSGDDRLRENALVVALSLDRDWMTPEQAQRVVDMATAENLLERVDDHLQPTFDPTSVTIPDGFEPDESMFQQRSVFERLLETICAAGHDRQEAVAAINALQNDLGVTVEAAAVVYARRQGLSIEEPAAAAARNLRE